NYMVTLFDEALSLFERAGIERKTAQAMLVRLGESALSNLSHLSPSQALTGPVRRGDVATVEQHLAAFDAHGLESARRVYKALLDPTVALARKAGLPEGLAAAMQSVAREHGDESL